MNDVNENSLQQHDSSELALATLISELADQANRGDELSLEEACKKHPQFETDLRELWGTIVVTSAAAKEQNSHLSLIHI